MLVRPARSLQQRGYLAVGFGGSGGTSQAMSNHNALVTNGLLMPTIYYTLIDYVRCSKKVCENS